MTDITDAGPRLKAMNDRLEELRAAADKADAEYREEIARLRLTDEERKALEIGIGILSDAGWGTVRLRALLKRLSPPTT
jgi:hypothetical protein